MGNDYFNFYLTKKGKTKEDLLQLENVWYLFRKHLIWV
jgi:hypothetical protein